jgi:predicted  nucleic acid-binding Zn-ribbon protein
MEIEAILHRLEGLESKLKKLLQEHEVLKAHIMGLEAENDQLNAKLQRKEEELKNFQNQDKISKLVTSIAEGTPNSTELKLRINEYIKEIDRCIVYLSE